MNRQVAAKIGAFYAQALFELAVELDALEPVASDLEALERLLADTPQFAEMLRSPAFGTENRRQVLENIFRGRLSDTVLDTLLVANCHNRLAFLPAIIREFASIRQAASGRSAVHLTVARPLDQARTDALRKNLENILQTEIELEIAVKPAIIGGIIIRFGEKVVDNSVLSRLNKAMAAVRKHETARAG